MASRNLVVVIIDENYEIQNATDGNLAYAEICDNKRHIGSLTCLISTNRYTVDDDVDP